MALGVVAPRRAAPSYSNVLVSKGTSGVTARYPHPLAVPERPGLRDDGAEDGDGAEEDEGAVYGGALTCLEVEARMVSGRLGAQVECMAWGCLCLCTCETPRESSSGMSVIVASGLAISNRLACIAGWAGSVG